MTRGRPQPPSRKWRLVLALALLAAAALWTRHLSGLRAVGAAAAAGGGPPAASGEPQLLFRCPDGRLGLHVVHTRFLITQAGANRIFVASRLQLMRTFMLPSLAAQTSQAFVLYAAHDPDLGQIALRPFLDALGTLSTHSVVNAEREMDMELDYAALAAKLEHLDPRVHEVDVFITSRMDLDDAVHVGAVEGVQRLACSRSGERTGASLVYLSRHGLLWFPSPMASPYGGVRTPRAEYKLYSHLAVLQSMVLTGADFLRTCPLNVYSYPHYKPAALEKVLRTTPGCRCGFKAAKDVARWEPPAGELAWLYTKTASSWTFGKKDQRASSRDAPTDVGALARSFALDKAALAAANLLFLGLEVEGAEAMQESTALELER